MHFIQNGKCYNDINSRVTSISLVRILKFFFSFKSFTLLKVHVIICTTSYANINYRNNEQSCPVSWEINQRLHREIEWIIFYQWEKIHF